MDTVGLLMAGWNVLHITTDIDLVDGQSPPTPASSGRSRHDRDMTVTFEVGSLVQARGREWVVQPGCSDDLLIVRPLGGGVDDTAGGAARRGTDPARDVPTAVARRPRRRPLRPAPARCPADRVPILRRTVPLPGGHRGQPRPYQVRAASAGTAPGHGASAHRRRRGHRQDRRSWAYCLRAAGHGEIPAAGRPLPAEPGRTMAQELVDQVRPGSRTGPARYDPPPGTRPGHGRIGLRPSPRHRRVHRLHQGRTPPQRLPARGPRPGDRR